MATNLSEPGNHRRVSARHRHTGGVNQVRPIELGARPKSEPSGQNYSRYVGRHATAPIMTTTMPDRIAVPLGAGRFPVLKLDASRAGRKNMAFISRIS